MEEIIVEELGVEEIVVKDYVEPQILVSFIEPTDTSKLWVDKNETI